MEIKATLSYKEPSTSKVHGCNSCINGDIAGKIRVNFIAKLIDSDSLNFKAGMEENVHIADFYYSLDFNEFGLGKCPHYLYKIAVTVVDKQGTGVKDVAITTQNGFYIQGYNEGETITNVSEAVITDALITNEKGIAIGYLLSDEYSLKISKGKYGVLEKEIHVLDNAKAVQIRYEMGGESTGENVQIVLGGSHNAFMQRMEVYICYPTP